MAVSNSVPVKKETIKQKILRMMYPLIRKMGKKGSNGTVIYNEHQAEPVTSFYALKVSLNNGETLSFAGFKGKKVILVNTASDCGFTGQYSELQKLHQIYGESLQIIAFPANDFKGQEKSNDSEIASFCQVNYGVTFPVALKGRVIKDAHQQQVFKWLTDKSMNGWNEHAPDWNFGKYVVNERGVLTSYFGPSVSPLDEEFLNALKKLYL